MTQEGSGGEEGVESGGGRWRDAGRLQESLSNARVTGTVLVQFGKVDVVLLMLGRGVTGCGLDCAQWSSVLTLAHQRLQV